MKKVISIILSLIMLVSVISGMSMTANAAVWNGSAASSFAGGKGTKSSPYLISSASQLARMRNLVNSTNYKNEVYAKSYYKLTADISLNDTSNYSKWGTSAPKNKWKPIGVSGYPFKGNFDGNGHTIAGIYISTTDDYMGLFGRVYGGIVKNLKISRSYIKGNENIGAVTGYLSDSFDSSAYLYNCSVSSTTIKGVNSGDVKAYNVGGVVGSVSDKAFVYNCTSSANVSGYYNVGGIVGYAWEYEKCAFYANKNTGKITGNHNVGGVCGYFTASDCSSAKVYGNTNTASVLGENSVGGVFGEFRVNSTACTISKCYNTGVVSNSNEGSSIGGVFGELGKSNCNFTVSLCYNKGSINSNSSSSYVGGIAGNIYSSGTGYLKISDCSNDCSSISASNNAGGIAGIIYNDKGKTIVSNCINKASIKTNSSYDHAGGIVGKIINSDSENATSVTIEKNIITGSVSSLQKPGSIVGYSSTSYSNNITNVINNRYLVSSGSVVGEYYGDGKTNISMNSSATSSQLKDESYLSDLGFYICMWNIPGDQYPTVNFNGTHSFSVTSVKKASATDKTNGKIYKTCDICGKKTYLTVYYPKTVILSATQYVYNGYAKKPAAKVKNSAGAVMSSSNYTVSYPSGRKYVGKYTVTVKFKGNYTGSLKASFVINPMSTSVSSISAKSKGFTVRWKKQATQTSGYQIQYATNSKFTNSKTVNVSKNSTTSKTISKLSSKKKYYVRVRTYKTVNSKRYYSSWSSGKSITTK